MIVLVPLWFAVALAGFIGLRVVSPCSVAPAAALAAALAPLFTAAALLCAL